MAEKENKGSMTVAEAGRKGGETVKAERGREFYEQIGKKGGQKVRELIAQAKLSQKQAADVARPAAVEPEEDKGEPIE